jgi:disulfide oxidoreductase YuzD
MDREDILRDWSSQSYSYRTLRSLLNESAGHSHTHNYMYPRVVEADPALVEGSPRCKIEG